MKRQEYKTPQPSPGPENGIKGRLLIVDDETAIRWALRKTLQRMNFEIAEAETGEQRSEEHTSELQSLRHLVCRLLRCLHSFLHDALPISDRGRRNGDPLGAAQNPSAHEL